ncbi:TonB-dependent siderophore receptor [Acidisoma cellulosilytica]|uniref:TonB-dependent siderophore receptor n=1 Tax=Acidisoma cellulosilyticum TaxID=2802395 RepID=A0A963Z6R8_9PROT|nr:TonB-dependent siderophore receptor [Acidisoma cellulosilyticum]MCB8883596.1 TonB-dependent siderophore receptor [Acidisoma cellulosilyticum]
MTDVNSLSKTGRSIALERRWIGRLMATTMLVMAGVSAASAQTAQSGLANATTEAPSARLSFAIPRQSLDAALAAYSQATHLQVLVPGELTRGVLSPGVTGSMSAQDGLRHLLAGTGLMPTVVNAQTISVEKIPTDDPSAINLPPVQVTGHEGVGNGGYGRVSGFVAHSSSTATKTNTPLIETPQSVVVITRDQMNSQGNVQDIRGILRYAPGTYISDDNDERIETLLVRGFQPDQYLDGLKLLSGTFSSLKVDPYMLQEADLLEGPSSVLYGEGSPGGLLNMVSKRPTDEPLHDVQIQAGTGNRFEGAFDLSGPLNDSGTLLYRLTGLARTEQPDVNHMTEQRIDISPALTWRPDADTSLTILTNYLHDPKGGFYDLLPYEGTLIPTPTGTISQSLYPGQPDFYNLDREQFSVGYDFEHRFNSIWKVSQNARYIYQNLAYSEVQPISLQANGQTLNTVPYVDNEHDGAFTVDNEAQARFSTGPLAHTLLLGVDYQRQMLDTMSRYSSASQYVIPLDINDPDYNQTVLVPPVSTDNYQQLNQIGAYAQDQIKFGRWSFLMAGREDWASTQTQNYLTGVTTNQFARAFTGHLGLTYLFDNGFAPYVSYSTSFQPTSGTDYSGAAFKPTTGKQEEVGVKYHPPGINALITVAAFNLLEDNVLTTDPDHANYNVQTGQVRSRGLEISGVTSLTSGLSLRASYTHLDSDITSANNGTQGNQLADTPNNMASIWSDYTIQSHRFAGFGFGGGVKYMGTSYAANTNTYKIPDYFIVDTVLHYDLSGLGSDLKGAKLALNAYNLFNNQYVSYCSAVGCRWGVGRSVLVTLDYQW